MTRTPFFIAGAGRSGSTYLYYILKAHPKVAITNEARVVDAISLAFEALTLPRGERSAGSGMMGAVSYEAGPVLSALFLPLGRRMFEEYYERAFTHDFSHFGDKLPDPYAVGMSAKLFPDIRTVTMVRDPRDVVCSYRSLQASTHDLGNRADEMRASTVADFAHTWRKSYEILYEFIPDSPHVNYVDLIERPLETTKAVLAHLGLPLVPEIERAIASNDTIGGHGTSRTAADSMGRWKRDLSAAEAALVVDICKPMMDRVGLKP